jgi:hypothetical protein
VAVDVNRTLRPGESARLAALFGCLVGSLALYAALAILLSNPPAGRNGIVGFSLASAPLFRAFTGIPATAFSATAFTRSLAVALALLWALWGLALAASRGLSSVEARRRARWIVLVGGAVLLGVVVVFVPPLLSGDLYRQALYGRMVGHGLNPYATPVSALASDPLLPFANHRGVTTTYGPAYTWLSALVAALAPGTPLGLALAWKLTAALAALGCALLAASLASALRRGDAAADEVDLAPPVEDDGAVARLWVAWNPLVVLEAAASGHLEPIMMLPALGGLLLLHRRRSRLGFAMLLLSTLTKWVTGVLLVLMAVRELRVAEPEHRLRAAVRLAVPSALLGALLYAPFASGLTTGSGLHDLALHGAGALGESTRATVPQWALLAGFAMLTLGVARFATAGEGFSRPIAVASTLMLVFILFVVPWLFPWYLLAPMVLVAVLPPGRAATALRFTCAAVAAILSLYYARLS